MPLLRAYVVIRLPATCRSCPHRPGVPRRSPKPGHSCRDVSRCGESAYVGRVSRALTTSSIRILRIRILPGLAGFGIPAHSVEPWNAWLRPGLLEGAISCDAAVKQERCFKLQTVCANQLKCDAERTSRSVDNPECCCALKYFV